MGSKKIVERRFEPDPNFNSIKVTRFINHVMRKGKKNVARKIVYDAFDIIKEKTKEEPLEIFEKAINNVMPRVEVRSRRVGGATYQVPYSVGEERGMTLAVRWIIRAAKIQKAKPMKEKLAEELIEAAENKGEAVRKRINIHKIAQANRAFAHLAR